MKAPESGAGRLSVDEYLRMFPIDSLKQVDTPTVRITEDIQRIDCREIATMKAIRGDYGNIVKNATQNHIDVSSKYQLLASMQDSYSHLSNILLNGINEQKTALPEDPKVLSNHIKSVGYFLNASMVGICQLPKYAIYSHDSKGNTISLDYRFAIVVIASYEQQNSPWLSKRALSTDFFSRRSYLQLAVIANTMANYIRRLGYPASSQNVWKSSEAQAIIPPLLLLSGLGEVSRTGMILNPFLGLNYKATAVLTDLPLMPDKPIDFGLQDYCHHCKRCAVSCPCKAISMKDKVLYNGYETWKFNERLCVSYHRVKKTEGACDVCMTVCPWSRSYTWTNNIVRKSVQSSKIIRMLSTKLENTCKHKKEKNEKWWFTW